jgi:hypothetical protein
VVNYRRKAMSAETELHRQNERLNLLLNLTSRITSSLDLREVLRSIAANIREPHPAATDEAQSNSSRHFDRTNRSKSHKNGRYISFFGD